GRLFPESDRTQAPTEYCCIFGISKPNSKFPKYSSQNVLGNDYSYLVASGPNHRIYWFLFKKLPKMTYGLYDKIPKFTEEERDALAAEHANNPITEDLRFGELYANRTTATLQALPEVVFSRWHYRRIITIGDAAHKFNPIGGQGGNSAIEDAAVLSNQLYCLLKADASSAFSETNLTRIFETMHSIRHDRATGFMKRSHELQSMQAQDTFVMKIVAKYVIPGSSPDSMLEMFSQMARPAARLDMMDVPKREHVDLYYDERVAKPIESKIPQYIAYAIFLALSTAVTVNVRIPDIPVPSSKAEVQSVTGIQTVDTILGLVAQAFAESISWADAGHTLLSFYLLMFLAPILLIWYIEGNRQGSRRSIISWPSIFGLAIHAHSIALIAPLSFLSHIWTTGGAKSTLGRYTRPSVAKCIGPAVFLGYIVPTTFLFVPSVPRVYGVHLITAWLFGSISISAILAFVPHVLEDAGKKPGVEDSNGAFAQYRNDDIPTLNKTYKIAFAASLIYHSTTILFLLLGSGHPALAPSRFLPSSATSLSTSMFTFLKQDLYYAVAAVALFGLYSVFELRAKGLVTSSRALRVGALFLGAQGAFGPGAALVALWWWKEGVLVAGAGSVEVVVGKREEKAGKA
ncbi:fad binding domain-containing protein, partial [Stemphylium lycopersici]